MTSLERTAAGIGLPVDVAKKQSALARHDSRKMFSPKASARPTPQAAQVVDGRLLERAPGRVRRVRRRWLVAGAVAGATSVLAGMGWLLVQLVELIAAHAIQIAGAVALVLLVWAAAGQAGVCCPGIHCPGCRHR